MEVLLVDEDGHIDHVKAHAHSKMEHKKTYENLLASLSAPMSETTARMSARDDEAYAFQEQDAYDSAQARVRTSMTPTVQ